MTTDKTAARAASSDSNTRFLTGAMLVSGCTPDELESAAITAASELTGRPEDVLEVSSSYTVYALDLANPGSVSTNYHQAAIKAKPEHTLYASIYVREPLVPGSAEKRLARAFAAMLEQGILGIRWMNQAGIGSKPVDVPLEKHLESWLRHG